MMKIVLNVQGRVSESKEIEVAEDAVLDDLLHKIEETTDMSREEIRLIHKGKLINQQMLQHKLQEDIHISAGDKITVLQTIRSRQHTPSQPRSQQEQTPVGGTNQSNGLGFGTVFGTITDGINVVVSTDQNGTVTRTASDAIEQNLAVAGMQILNSFFQSIPGLQGIINTTIQNVQRQGAAQQADDEERAGSGRQTPSVVQNTQSGQQEVLQINIDSSRSIIGEPEEEEEENSDECVHRLCINIMEDNTGRFEEQPYGQDVPTSRHGSNHPYEHESAAERWRGPNPMTQMVSEFEERDLVAEYPPGVKQLTAIYQYNTERLQKRERQIMHMLLACKSPARERHLAVKAVQLQKVKTKLCAEYRHQLSKHIAPSFVQRLENQAGHRLNQLSKQQKEELARYIEDEVKKH